MHEHLSAPVRAYLAMTEARFDPSDRADEASLRALLEERGHPAYPALFEIERAVGGLVVGDQPEHETVWGTYRLLRDQLPESRPGWATLEHEGTELVWVGATSATTVYARPDGTIVERDFFTGNVVVSASNIERRLLRDHVILLDDAAGLDDGDNFAGRQGAALADAFDATIEDDYSDAYHRWWRGDGVSIVETVYPYDGEWTTTFTCKSAAQADRARALLSA